MGDIIPDEIERTVFLTGILLRLFWGIQKWVGTQKYSLGNRKEQRAFGETAKLIGVQAKPAWEDFMQKVGSLPTEIQGK